MKDYSFDQDEINLIVKALRYATEYGYECPQCQEEVDEYNEMQALIKLLDPKPEQKEGWMNIYASGTPSTVHKTVEEAVHYVGYVVGVTRTVKVTWEE